MRRPKQDWRLQQRQKAESEQQRQLALATQQRERKQLAGQEQTRQRSTAGQINMMDMLMQFFTRR